MAGQATPSTPTTTPSMALETVTLIGRAYGLAFAHGTAIWSLAVRRRHPQQVTDFNHCADSQRVLEKFESMDEGSLIGVIAELPPARQRIQGAHLNVLRLELLGKAQEVAA